MKHIAMQTNLTLGRMSVRAGRGKVRRNLAKSKNVGLRHVPDNQVEWVLKNEPSLAMAALLK